MKLNSEELHNLYSSLNIIRQIKSRRMRWARHVASMGEERKCARFKWKSPKKRDHSEDRGVDGRMGSGRILGRLAGGCEFSWLRRNRWRALANVVRNLRGLVPRN
jgi:hypothetical protein